MLPLCWRMARFFAIPKNHSATVAPKRPCVTPIPQKPRPTISDHHWIVLTKPVIYREIGSLCVADALSSDQRFAFGRKHTVLRWLNSKDRSIKDRCRWCVLEGQPSLATRYGGLSAYNNQLVCHTNPTQPSTHRRSSVGFTSCDCHMACRPQIQTGSYPGNQKS